MSETISIFNIGQHQEEMNASLSKPTYESNLFDPKLKDINDKIAFICRPMPYYKDPVHSIARKNYYALQDAAGTVMFDSMTTFNDPAAKHYEFCPVGDLWLKLRNAKDPNVNALTAKLRMQKAAYCYMQIVNYPADPTLNGKIMPMRIPNAMLDTFTKMAQPNDQERALGAVPVQPFDIMNGKDILVNISGKMVGTTLMREWVVAPHGDCKPAMFPLGPNGQLTPVTMLPQDAVMQYFAESQTEDLAQVYGYHEPSIDVKTRVKNILRTEFAHIPGLAPIIEGYFPEVVAAAPNDAMAQPAPQPIPAAPVAPQAPAMGGVNPMEAAVAQPNVGGPIMPASQPAPMPEPIAPAPMPAPVPEPIPAAPVAPQPAPMPQAPVVPQPAQMPQAPAAQPAPMPQAPVVPQPAPMPQAPAAQTIQLP